MKTLRINIPDDLAYEIDLLIKMGYYSSRNELVFKALNELLSREFIKVKSRLLIVNSD